MEAAERDAEEQAGQDELGDVAPRIVRELGELDGRAPLEVDGGQHHDQGAQPEAGHRQAEDRPAARDVVAGGVLADGRERCRWGRPGGPRRRSPPLRARGLRDRGSAAPGRPVGGCRATPRGLRSARARPTRSTGRRSAGSGRAWPASPPGRRRTGFLHHQDTTSPGTRRTNEKTITEAMTSDGIATSRRLRKYLRSTGQPGRRRAGRRPAGGDRASYLFHQAAIMRPP